MNKLSNHVQLKGRIGQDVVLKQTKTGKNYLNVSLATNERYKNGDGEYKEETSWHNLIAWGYIAENMAKTLSKGSDAIITGKLKYDTYEDKEGNKRYATKIQVDEFVAGKSN